jgi:insulysin
MINITKPNNEDRDIKYILLPNKIQCILISDKHLDKSYVVTCINTGSLANKGFSDGIAHLLEHMCFITSKKYKEINYLQKKITEYGGWTNAYTSTFETVYYWNIFTNYLEQMMEIFVDYLFNAELKEEHIKNEIKNVDSEHQKNLLNDFQRIFNIEHLLSNKNGNYNTFFTGSLQTLNKKDIHKQLIQFYKKYYVSENISVAICSNLSTNDLFTFVNKWYGLIPHSKKDIVKIYKPLFESHYNNTYIIDSINNVYYLKYIYETDNHKSFYKTKVYHIIAYFFNIKNKNTISDFLLINNYIITINAYWEDKEGLFIIFINLTSKGYNNIQLIDGYIKYYINYIFSLDFVNLYQYQKKINAFNFCYCNKKNSLDLALTLATNCFKYQFIDIYSGDYLFFDYIDKHVIEAKKTLFNKPLKLLITNKFNFSKHKYFIDPFYNTKYIKIKNIDGNIIKFNSNFHIDNKYIYSKPLLIKNLFHNSPIKINDYTWFGNISKFNEPIYYVTLIFNSPKYNNTPINYLLTLISISLLDYYINMNFYDVFETNNHINIHFDNYFNNFIIDFTLLNDLTYSTNIINNLLSIFKNKFIFSNHFINRHIKNIKTKLKDIKNISSWDFTDYLLNLMFSNNYHYDILIKEINNIKPTLVINWLNTILFDTNITFFIYGNIHKPVKIYIDNYKNKYYNQSFKLKNKIIIKHPNKNETNNSIKIIFWVSKFNPIDLLYISITKLIFGDMFYDDLRTKQQLGYLVNLGSGIKNKIYFIFQQIQSTYSIQELEKRINIFNSKIIHELNNIDFDKWINVLKKHLLKKKTSMDEYYYKYYDEIINNEFLFDKDKILIYNLKNINKNDYYKWLNTYIINNKNKTILATYSN